MATQAGHAWNFNINFIGQMRRILWLSVILSVASVALVWARGLNFGTDFAGGYEVEVHLPSQTSETQIRDVLEPVGLSDVRVQRFGAESDNAFLILVQNSPRAMTPERLSELRHALEGLSSASASLVDLSLSEGGESFTAVSTTQLDEDAVRTVLGKLGVVVKHMEQTTQQHGHHVLKVSLPSLADDISQTLVTGLKLEAGTKPVERVAFVGPQVGAELRNDGILAVAYSLFFIFLYVAFRFDMLFSPGAILATLHDIVLTMGFLSLCQIDFNLTVVTAILTLIGFSLNDTVVVFDRIRENAVRLRGTPLRSLVNLSINETLSRTILTSGTVLLVTGALMALGGPQIWAFSVTMFVGVVIGTYSSIAVASPIYIAMREHSERSSQVRRPKGARSARKAASAEAS